MAVMIALWYVSRATGMLALLLLTGTVVLGTLTGGRATFAGLPRFAVAALHRNLSLLTLAFLVVHVATAVIDDYAGIGWLDTVLPFVSVYHPFWLGLGAVAFDLLLALAGTSLLRTRIPPRAWRAVQLDGLRVLAGGAVARLRDRRGRHTDRVGRRRRRGVPGGRRRRGPVAGGHHPPGLGSTKGAAMTMSLSPPRLLTEPATPFPAYSGSAGRERLIRAVEESGLRGRGGAAFPTGRKLRAVAAVRGRRTVVVNACEGEPVSHKDRTLMARSPHLVLDGALLVAQAVRASEVVVCGREPVPARGDAPVPVRWQPVPRRYVASEESALVRLLTTGDARPTTKPPRPVDRGMLVSNAETFAHIALIARHGPQWFRAVGPPDSPGTTLITVTGAVRMPGVWEVPCGTPIGHALDAPRAAPDAQAVLVGGIAGTWLPMPFAASVGLSPEELSAAGATLGTGALYVLPADACGLAETARIVHYLAAESARQCGPCMFGLPSLTDDLTHLSHGTVDRDLSTRLTRRLAVIADRGACRHPDGAVRVARSALHVFAADLRRHLAGRPCEHTAHTLLPWTRR
jgi:NADH:ubiquinone oxidoreductase subunit F (NADH-binding)